MQSIRKCVMSLLIVIAVKIWCQRVWLRPTQCHSICRIKCTIKKKVYDVIIDSGSSENVVSKSVVKTMGLTIVKHPSPHKVLVKEGH